MKRNERKVGAILSYFVIVLNMVIGLIYTPYLTRMLGQAEYGLYSLIGSIISYLTVLDFGLGNAIIIYTTKYKGKKEALTKKSSSDNSCQLLIPNACFRKILQNCYMNMSLLQ